MNWNKYLKYLWWATVISITVLSLMPPESGRELPTNDKVGHFMAYGVFAFISLSYGIRRFSISKILLFNFSFGILMEYCQGFIPGREPSLLDALANTGGIILGGLIYFYNSRKKNS
jgi:VanZ family protein